MCSVTGLSSTTTTLRESPSYWRCWRSLLAPSGAEACKSGLPQSTEHSKRYDCALCACARDLVFGDITDPASNFKMGGGGIQSGYLVQWNLSIADTT